MQICCVVCLWRVFFYICNEFHCNHWLNALLFSIVWCFGTVRLSWCCRDCYMCSRHCWGFYAEYFRVVDWPTLCPFLMRRYSIFFPSCCNVFSSDLLSPPLFNTNWRPCMYLWGNLAQTIKHLKSMKMFPHFSLSHARSFSPDSFFLSFALPVLNNKCWMAWQANMIRWQTGRGSTNASLSQTGRCRASPCGASRGRAGGCSNEEVGTWALLGGLSDHLMSGTRAACDGERAGHGERQISLSAVKLGWQEGEMDGGGGGGREQKNRQASLRVWGRFIYSFIYFYSDRNAHEWIHSFRRFNAKVPLQRTPFIKYKSNYMHLYCAHLYCLGKNIKCDFINRINNWLLKYRA